MPRAEVTHQPPDQTHKNYLLSFVAVLGVTVANAAETADTIYSGGDIITIHDAAPAAEALAVKDGKILAVGSKADVFKTKGGATRLVDLGGKTLIPGFVDAHSHFGESAFRPSPRICCRRRMVQ